MEIAAEIEASDEIPMDEEAIELELRSRRGGYSRMANKILTFVDAL